MTRYILAGGADRRSPTFLSDLSKVLATNRRPMRVLSCQFAKPREDWERTYMDWQPDFTRYFGADTLAELAYPHIFEQQVLAADVVYLHGGDDTLLEHYLSRYKHLDRLFEGKTIIGSSAGATFLSTYAWTCDWRAVWKGSGLLKVRVMVHYGSAFNNTDPRGPIDWTAARRELEAYAPDLPLHCLHEGEFVIVDQP